MRFRGVLLQGICILTGHPVLNDLQWSVMLCTIKSLLGLHKQQWCCSGLHTWVDVHAGLHDGVMPDFILHPAGYPPLLLRDIEARSFAVKYCASVYGTVFH